MERSKKRLSALSVVLLIVAIAMLLLGGVGGARAALSTPSNTHEATLQMQNLAVTLLENGKPAGKEILKAEDFLAGDKSLKIGKKYNEVLTVQNDGADAYVRVILYRYWKDDSGKRVEFDPNYIKLGLGKDWVEDKSASTSERVVLYYTKPLASKEISPAVLETITIDGKLATMVTQTIEGKTITNEYTYNGLNFGLKAEVDAVQTHNAEDAIRSAWGKKVTFNADGSIKEIG